MNWVTHVDLDRKIVRPIRQKRGLQIEFHYPDLPQLEALIDRQVAWALEQGYDVTDPTGAVFRRPNTSRRTRIGDWRKEWRAAMAKAAKDVPGFGRDLPGYKPGLHFHGFRSTVVTTLLDLGVRPKLITRLTGHRSLAMIDAYDRPGHAQFAEAMEKMDQRRRHLKLA